MRMRIENQLQGELIIDSAPGYGTTIIANLKTEEL
jgi:signal transduction histidine kinase